MSLKEYKSGTAFNGVIGHTFDQTQPTWTESKRSKKGALDLAQLYIEDKLVGNTEFPHTSPLGLGNKWYCTDLGISMSPFYKESFGFTKTIHRITIDVSGDAAELRHILARQKSFNRVYYLATSRCQFLSKY